MWEVLASLSKVQLTKYATVFGQIWYLLTFIFRLIVILSLGSSVYGDEQSSFRCNTQSPACEEICYNNFAYMSQIRFWGFQLIAVMTPTVLFHFYATYVNRTIEKLKDLREETEPKDDPKISTLEKHTMLHDLEMNGYDGAKRRKLEKTEKKVGKVKTRTILKDDGAVEKVYVTNKIQACYFVCLVLRCIMEGVFICLTVSLYDYGLDPACEKDYETRHCEPLDSFISKALWLSVPTLYLCSGGAAQSACAQQLQDANNNVPCWVSRPYEKTVFLRYMQVINGICFLLCLIEIVFLPVSKFFMRIKKQKKIVANAQNRTMTVTSTRTPPFTVEEINYPPPTVITHNDRDYVIVKELKPKNDYYDDEDSHLIKNHRHKGYTGSGYEDA